MAASYSASTAEHGLPKAVADTKLVSQKEIAMEQQQVFDKVVEIIRPFVKEIGRAHV